MVYILYILTGATTNLLFGTNRCNCNSLIFCASTCIVMKMKNGTKSYDRKQTLMTVNHSLIFLEGQQELSQSSCFLLSFCEGWENMILFSKKKKKYFSKIHITYRTLKDGKFDRKSGTGPVKLLFDRSLKWAIKLQKLLNVIRNESYLLGCMIINGACEI